MNDDRKFKGRAELVKQLLLAHVSSDVITKIVGISQSTLTTDRNRVAKMYGIKVPKGTVSSIDRAKSFRLLLKAFLKVKFETHNQEDPLYEAAKLTIDFERIENHIYTIESLFERLENPRFTSNDQMAKNYQKLIEDCISGQMAKNSYPSLNEFYRAVHAGIVPIEEVNNEQDLIELATKFYCEKDRSGINTAVIDDPKSLVDTLLLTLSETQVTVLKNYYGLECEKKTPDEIGCELRLSRERIRQIRGKALCIIRNSLNEKRYLIHSTDKYNHLEQQYAELDEKYKKYCEQTDQEIINLKVENARLRGAEDCDQKPDDNDYSPTIQFLILPIEEIDLPTRVRHLLPGWHVLDFIENWDNLLKIPGFGRKCRTWLDDYCDYYEIDRHKLTVGQKALARRLIERSK